MRGYSKIKQDSQQPGEVTSDRELTAVRKLVQRVRSRVSGTIARLLNRAQTQRILVQEDTLSSGTVGLGHFCMVQNLPQGCIVFNL